MAKTKKSKRELEDYVPNDIDKSFDDETYGNGMGQIMKAYEFPREDREIPKRESLPREPRMVPYTYPDKIETIMITKLFEKLAKLAKSQKK